MSKTSNILKGSLMIAAGVVACFTVGTVQGFYDTAAERGNFKSTEEAYKFGKMCKIAGDKFKTLKNK